MFENKELGHAFKESDSMGGNDPYSASKGAAELVTTAYRHSFFKNNKIGIASVRSGNVIGGGDWSIDRLIPDCFRSLYQNKVISIRNPNAVRPWQFVLEPIFGMLSLSSHLQKNTRQFSESWNFGPSSSKKITVDIFSDETKVNSFSIDADKGFNEAIYDVSFSKNGLKAYQKAHKDADLKKAKNDVYYLPKGKYTVKIGDVKGEFEVK